MPPGHLFNAIPEKVEDVRKKINGRYWRLSVTTALVTVAGAWTGGSQAGMVCVDAAGSAQGSSAAYVNDVACGIDAVAAGDVGSNIPAVSIGHGTSAYGSYSVSVGVNATSGYDAIGVGLLNSQNIAIGGNASAGTVDFLTQGNFGNTAVGFGSYAGGKQGRWANNGWATAIGAGAAATDVGAVAVGVSASATEAGAVAVGNSSNVAGAYGVALGKQSESTFQSVSIGNGARSTEESAIAIGNTAVASGKQSIAVGTYDGFGVTIGGASGERAIAMGYSAKAAGANAISMGSFSSAQPSSSVAVGYAAHSTGTGALAFGAGSSAINQNDVALGANSATSTVHTGTISLFGSSAAAAAIQANGVVSVGTPTQERQIQNVAAGVVSAASTDAVNGSQLFGAVQGINNQGTSLAATLGGGATYSSASGTVTGWRATIGATSYTDIASAIEATAGAAAEAGASSVKYETNPDGSPNYKRVTLTGAGGTVISNVANGIVDTDAVNVGQLKAAVSGLLTGDGLAVRYVADVTGKPTNAIALTGDGTGSPVRISNVAVGIQDSDAATYGQVRNQVAYDTDGSGARTNTISLSGTAAQPVTISNLAAGTKTTDAVNLGQLNGVRDQAYRYTDSKVAELKAYTDNRFEALSGDIRSVQTEARAGIASAMAAAQLRYGTTPGKLSVGASVGGFKDATSVAVGFGFTSADAALVMNGSVGVSTNTGDVAWGVGMSYSF